MTVRGSMKVLAAVAVTLGLVAAPMIPVGAATASTASTALTAAATAARTTAPTASETASVPATVPGATPPSAVASWFSTRAVAVIRDTAAGGTSLGAGRVDFSTASAVGTPHRVSTWSRAFLTAGTRYRAAVSASTLWIAAIRAPSGVIGTIVATSGAAGVAFVSYDDQVDLGGALSKIPSTTVVVHDPELSSWVSLAAGRVRAMTAMTAVDLRSSMALATYRGILITRHASAAANSAGKAGATGGGGPVIPTPETAPVDAVTGWGGATLVLLGGGGLALYLRSRRHERARPAVP